MRKTLTIASLLLASIALNPIASATDFWEQSGVVVTPNQMNIALDLTTFNLTPGGEAQIMLPGGLEVTAKLTRLENHQLGGVSWVGTVGADDKAGQILVTAVSGFAFGEIIYNDERYLIEPREGTTGHVIFKSNDPSRIEMEFENDGIIPPPPTAQDIANESISAPAVTGTNGAIDVGLFYHDSMTDRWGLGLAARLQFLVSLYDTALVNSITGLRANLVHIEQRAGTLGGKSNGDTLMDLRDNVTNVDGDFSGIEAIRTAKGIDVVSYIRRFQASTHVSCGTGFVLGTGGLNTLFGGASSSYNTVSDDIDIDRVPGEPFFLCSLFTLAHEIGHNMGTQHDIEDTPADGVLRFSHGYRVDGKFRTIMGTASEGGGEARLGLFSNPDLILCNDPSTTDPLEACGVVNADAARSMREVGLEMAGFRATGTRVVSAVLPSSRSIGAASTGGVATAFATVINPAGDGTALGCGLALPGATAAQFSYQTTSAANVVTGTADTPIDIPAGAAQSFVFAITPGGEFTGADIPIDFFCSNRASAESTNGLNTLFFSAVDGTTPDVIALSATASGDGIVNVPADTLIGAFSVAAANVGAAGTVTVTGEPSAASIPATVSVCETNPVTAACLAAPAASVVSTLAANGTATFSFFVTQSATIPADLANTRIIARFREGGSINGSTSVAVRTMP